MSALSHIDDQGRARMVDVSTKPLQQRTAVARGTIRLQAATLEQITAHQLTKGDVLNTARIAGIQAAKRTADLIPLCHPLALSHIDLDLKPIPTGLEITATARVTAQTGVEMEALTAVAVAALTVYDMCKAVDNTMLIGDIQLVRKTKQ